MKIFGLASSQTFAESVARHLGSKLAEHEERAFEDGEHKIRPLESVRGEDVYVLHSLYGDPQESPNDKLCQLLFFIGAIRDADAAQVTAVVPYLCYARKDRKTKTHDPITTRYVAQLLESTRIDRLVAMDVHNPAAFQNAFRVPTVHLQAAAVFVHHIVRFAEGREIVVISPDAGGVKRADRLRMLLNQHLNNNVTLAMMEKHRSKDVVSGEMFAGDVEGRVAVIVDDLISTGTTLLRTAAACRKRGAVQVIAAATHALLVSDAGRALADDAFDQILVANTVPPFRLQDHPAEKKLTVVDVSPSFARAIRRIREGATVADEMLE